MKNNIPLFKVFMDPEVDESLSKVLHSGYIGQGQVVEKFEEELGKFLNNKHVLTVNSGTSALHLALRMANVKDGSVISTPLTCSATNFPILANDARILWADIDPDTGNIDPESVGKLLSENGDVRAVMAVHWGGYPCDLDEINSYTSHYAIPVIEDAAHAFGAEYKGERIGNLSTFTCFSFQAIKHLTTVDGGLLTTNSRFLYKRGKLLRWYGIDRENANSRQDLRCEDDIREWGYKFHMNDVNATIGLKNLENIENILGAHRDNNSYYRKELESVSGIKLLKEKDDRKSSSWLFTMKVERRDDFMKYMKEKGVMTSKVHARNDLYTCVRNFRTTLPNLEQFVKEMVCIPVGWHVGVLEREYIVECIKAGW